MAIADAFVAMTGDRPYEARLGVDDALEQPRAGAGRRHDPALVPRFIGHVRRLQGNVDDFDGCRAEAAGRSPFMEVRRKLSQRLAEPPH